MVQLAVVVGVADVDVQVADDRIAGSL